YLGELRLALDNLERSKSLYEQHHQSFRTQMFLYGADSGVLVYAYMARVLWLLGYPDRAHEMIRVSMDLAEKLRHPTSRAVTMSAAIALDAGCGDVRRAETTAKALIALSHEHCLPFYSAVGGIWHGWALAMQGHDKQGLVELQDAMTRYRSAGSELGRPSYLALLAEALGEAGQTSSGLNVVAEALAVAERTGERIYEGELHRLKG